jgi:hypothetical protein
MVESEWRRPLGASDQPPTTSLNAQTSPRAAIVLLFWTYFETRIERLIRAGLRSVQARIVDDMLDRYSAIGARINRLYSVAFGTTYHKDLADLGYSAVADHLRRVQDQRNAFAHGQPKAIDDVLVTDVVRMLKDEHEAWIAAFKRHVIK